MKHIELTAASVHTAVNVPEVVVTTAMQDRTLAITKHYNRLFITLFKHVGFEVSLFCKLLATCLVK